MNRLVIIGNGFDLAHGLKTSYEDFLLDYFHSGLLMAQKSDGFQFEDELIKVICHQVPVIDGGKNVWEVTDTFDKLMNNPFIHWPPSKFEGSLHLAPLMALVESEKTFFTIEILSEFFDDLIEQKKWTDIEKHYFNFLWKKFSKSEYWESEIESLNEDFEYLQEKLVNYLKGLNDSFLAEKKLEKKLWSFICRCFEPIDEETYVNKFYTNDDSINELENGEGHRTPESVCFLNFNYTDLLVAYLEKHRLKNRAFHYQIHGNVNNTNSIVFGYGDDTHKNYDALENADDDELLKNMKAFYYPSNSTYGNLINFIEAESFEVYVIGHSIGLSDRVLLKTIFEADKCKAIRLFHRGNENSHFKKRISLSRHFDNKIAMRKKIVDFNQDDAI